MGEEMLESLTQWMQGVEYKEATDFSNLKYFPFSQCLLKALISLNNKVKHCLKGMFERLKRSLISELQSVKFEDLLEKAGLE